MGARIKEMHKRIRNTKYKRQYRVASWPQYEQSLRNRGNLTLWLSPSAIKSWKAARSGKLGRQQKYSPFISHFDLTDSVDPQKTFLQPREDSSRQLLHKRFGHGQGIVSLQATQYRVAFFGFGH